MLSDLTSHDADEERISTFQRSKCTVGDPKRHFLPKIGSNKNARKATSGAGPLRSTVHMHNLTTIAHTHAHVYGQLGLISG